MEYKPRREARERCMQLLFQMETQQDFSTEAKELFLAQYNEENKKQDPHFERLYTAIAEHLPEIDEAITNASANWKISRFGKVDLAIVRLATAEILFFDKIPASVSINEAVEIAKDFGGDETARFVNGILGKIAAQKEENEKA